MSLNPYWKVQGNGYYWYKMLRTSIHELAGSHVIK